MKYRALPEIRKPVFDDVEETFRLGQRVHPELVSFLDWLEQLLLNASRAVRAAYEQELQERESR